jgi:chorismate dehydratase
LIRISVVSYLNSRPFIYGLRDFKFSNEIEITEDIPSVCADKLITGKADIGLVPVAALPFIKNYRIISDYCIGADGEVKSVLLLSDVPVEQIKTVCLDYQSRTSVMLARILFSEHWKTHPEFINAKEGYEKNIRNTTAGIVIGDRALVLRNKFKFAYDLSAEWKKMTSLPFVFAVWACISELSKTFINEFNSALDSGLKRIDEISEKEDSLVLNIHEIKSYLKENINYNFNDAKKLALHKFLQLMKSVNQNDD